jgi:hypothetical protein
MRSVRGECGGVRGEVSPLHTSHLTFHTSAFFVGACPVSNAAGSRFPLQVRTRRSSSLAGFPLQSLTRKCKTVVMLVVACFTAGLAKGQNVAIEADPVVEARIKQQTGNRHHVSIERIDRNVIPWDSSSVDQFTVDTLTAWLMPGIKWLLDSVMTQEDLDTVKVQIQQYRAGTWAGNSLGDARLVEPKPKMKMKKNDDYWAFSEPLYFSAGRRCLVKEEYQCGFMCAHYDMVLYELGPDGQWRFVRTISALAE